MNATRFVRARHVPAPIADASSAHRPCPGGFFHDWFIARAAARLRLAVRAGPVFLCGLILCGLALAAPLPAHAANRAQVATDVSGRLLRVDGSVVIVEPDIELSVVTAGGLQEPRQEWSTLARGLFPARVRAQLEGRQIEVKPDFDVADDLDPASQLGQILRLNQAVALSITQYSAPGNALATKRDAGGRPRMDWSLGPGVSVLREATGADYALFTYVRDSYASGGRTALRVLGILVGAAMGGFMDIGGGAQVGVATLVDLRTGQVVWYNLLANQSGDLRDPTGATRTAQRMLQQLPIQANAPGPTPASPLALPSTESSQPEPEPEP